MNAYVAAPDGHVVLAGDPPANRVDGIVPCRLRVLGTETVVEAPGVNGGGPDWKVRHLRGPWSERLILAPSLAAAVTSAFVEANLELETIDPWLGAPPPRPERLVLAVRSFNVAGTGRGHDRPRVYAHLHAAEWNVGWPYPLQVPGERPETIVFYQLRGASFADVVAFALRAAEQWAPEKRIDLTGLKERDAEQVRQLGVLTFGLHAERPADLIGYAFDKAMRPVRQLVAQLRAGGFS